MNNIDDYDYNLYVLAELNYKELFKDQKDIFPIDWYSTKDYKYKTEIILESLKNKKLIEDTELYQKRYENNKFIK